MAAESGANYVGIVFVPGRRRCLEPAAALVITDGLRGLGRAAPKSVGLFGDQPLGEVIDTISGSGVDCVQLCGDESVEDCRRVQEHARVIKVLHVPGDAGVPALEKLGDQIDSYSAAGCMVTLDSQVVGLHGGTGQSFDWGVAARLAESGRRFLLAGGLTPENVSSAIAQANPWGVDVSSGVETNGEKDHAKIKDFVANAKRVG